MANMAGSRQALDQARAAFDQISDMAERATAACTLASGHARLGNHAAGVALLDDARLALESGAIDEPYVAALALRYQELSVPDAARQTLAAAASCSRALEFARATAP